MHNGLIDLPTAIFDDRKNSASVNLDIESEAFPFEERIAVEMKKQWLGGAIVDGESYYTGNDGADILAPYDRSIPVGKLYYATAELTKKALQSAHEYFPIWRDLSESERVKPIQHLADLLEENMPELIALSHKEAGKTIHDGIDEVREAVDFCRYYAQQGVANFSSPQTIKSVAGIVFTGSTPTAQFINQALANRNVKQATFIAETGGQRCSALRVLFVQQDIAERVIELIKGAMDELHVGLPYLHKTDVGPVIDLKSKEQLMEYIKKMTRTQTLVKKIALTKECGKGDFVPPTAIEIEDLSCLTSEQFGPILHIVRYHAADIESLIDQVNSTGFGLTMGIHSRNETHYRHIERRSRVGNCYINRDQVGVQPFGGQGLSGTGPKAGGPRYLLRFTQQVNL